MTSTEPPFFTFFKIIQSLDLTNNPNEQLEKLYVDETTERRKRSRKKLYHGLFISCIAISAVIALLPLSSQNNSFWIAMNFMCHVFIFFGLLANHETIEFAERTKKEREMIENSLPEDKKEKKRVLDQRIEAYSQKISPILSSKSNQTILMDAFFNYFHLGTVESEDETSWFKSLQSCFNNKNYDKAPYYIRRLYNRIDDTIMERKLSLHQGALPFVAPTPLPAPKEDIVDVFAHAKELVARLTLETEQILKLANFDKGTQYKLNNILEEKLPHTLHTFCAIRPECLHDKDFNNQSPTDIFNSSVTLIENYLIEVKKNQNTQQIKHMEINRRHISKIIS